MSRVPQDIIDKINSMKVPTRIRMSYIFDGDEKKALKILKHLNSFTTNIKLVIRENLNDSLKRPKC